jgi:hypothetical protein
VLHDRIVNAQRQRSDATAWIPSLRLHRDGLRNAHTVYESGCASGGSRRVLYDRLDAVDIEVRWSKRVAVVAA